MVGHQLRAVASAETGTSALALTAVSRRCNNFGTYPGYKDGDLNAVDLPGLTRSGHLDIYQPVGGLPVKTAN